MGDALNKMTMKVSPPFIKIPKWDSSLVSKPPAIFRGAPFWSWNGELDDDRLARQLKTYDEMGIGGATVHVRTGLTSPYLGDEFMQHVKSAADEAQRLGMHIWLYDEDRWPSGAAGGLVTKDLNLRFRQLLMTSCRPDIGEPRLFKLHHNPPLPVTDRTFVAAWALQFSAGKLREWRRIEESEDAGEGEVAYYAYIEIAPSITWFNNQQYANLLNPEATRRFIEVTHERYAEVLGDRFGSQIPSIFTDEPLYIGMERPTAWDDRRDLRTAWVDDLPESYAEQFGTDLMENFPAVMFDTVDGTSAEARLKFHDHHAQRFSDSFAAILGAWCEEKGIALTGHMMEEQTPRRQTCWSGEVMRSLHHFQLPGIDMLFDNVEFTTAKQAQSVARQNGRLGTMSELYGVTNWDFPFAGHLRQGNWQAALGVIVRVHHLTWYSMAGEAKRDYPASIGGHMPWYGEYKSVEDHFARLAVALQTGRPLCRVGLLHPIESHWVVNGPLNVNSDQQVMIEDGFIDALTGMLEGQIDVDLVAESLLPLHGEPDATNGFRVGEMSYDVLVIPPIVTIRSTTLDRIERFTAAGGTVILLGAAPQLVDGVASDRAAVAAKSWTPCAASRRALLPALAPWREIELIKEGRRVIGPVYQLREEEDGVRILFLCSINHDPDPQDDGVGSVLRICGLYHIEMIDTLSGESSEPGERWTNDGWTELPLDLHVADHRLLRLHVAKQAKSLTAATPWEEYGRISDPVPVTLHEPNVLLLDRAEWSLDDGKWNPVDEILRVDNHVRHVIGLPSRHGDLAQPWAEPSEAPTHAVALRFTIQCDVAVASPSLALERASEATVSLNGLALVTEVTGFYVDEDIQTLSLPALEAGEHSLVIDWPFRPEYGLEACYLLGDFGVVVAGMHARIIEPVRALAFDDWTKQGLPFYGGNVTYHCSVELSDARTALRVPRFSGALLAVDLDGERLGQVIRAPYRIELPRKTGMAQLDVTCFGDRINTFGPLHNCNPLEDHWGPKAARTEGANWTDGYVLRRKGICVAPTFERAALEDETPDL
jgi:hypothetical protein